jgi:endopolyphosphatase
VEEEEACHRGEGPAGTYGAETTDCDSPISLINATFEWIRENLRDNIDFVIWTGDSARHDNDEQIPRSDAQVTDLNRMTVSKMIESFGRNGKDNKPSIPIIPTFGNNDILPHNIFAPGPNKWTKTYLDIWREFIPEEQRHGFDRGGWFFVEVIPNKLAVISLNTLYFFDNNAAVDGCADRSEPGYEQMEWLRIQLHFFRQRGMKAIIMGHVPPARTESKQSWDETCWQKYTLWMHQFRDVVTGSIYGHMNIDHFFLQDSQDVDLLAYSGHANNDLRSAMEDEMNVQSAAAYLTELRAEWSRLPDLSKVKCLDDLDQSEGPGTSKKRKEKKKKDKHLDKIGGLWGERYSLSMISPSVVPNYFPTLRVFEYNISGLDTASSASATRESISDLENNKMDQDADHMQARVKYPKGPSKSSPPGPAYSLQTFSLLAYTQYFANLTTINNDFTHEEAASTEESSLQTEKWKKGKHHGKKPKEKTKPEPNDFQYEIEYDTRNDTVYGLKDLTVRSYLDLATRMGKYKHRDDVVNQGKKHNKKGKHKRRQEISRTWFAFVGRAFVGTKDDEKLREDFG